MIMLLGFWLFEDSVVQIVTITFTALIISELLNVYTALTHLNRIVLLSQLLTFLIYIASIIFLRQQINVSAIDFTFIRRVGIIVLISWGPMQVIKMLRKALDPTENEKIMKSIK